MNAALFMLTSAWMAGADPAPDGQGCARSSRRLDRIVLLGVAAPPCAAIRVAKRSGLFSRLKGGRPNSCGTCCTPAPVCCTPAPVCAPACKPARIVHCKPAPVCCTPAPVCCTPAPVCCKPAPVCCKPAPVCCTPAPVCCKPAGLLHAGPGLLQARPGLLQARPGSRQRFRSLHARAGLLRAACTAASAPTWPAATTCDSGRGQAGRPDRPLAPELRRLRGLLLRPAALPSPSRPEEGNARGRRDEHRRQLDRHPGRGASQHDRDQRADQSFLIASRRVVKTNRGPWLARSGPTDLWSFPYVADARLFRRIDLGRLNFDDRLDKAARGERGLETGVALHLGGDADLVDNVGRGDRRTSGWKTTSLPTTLYFNGALINVSFICGGIVQMSLMSVSALEPVLVTLIS